MDKSDCLSDLKEHRPGICVWSTKYMVSGTRDNPPYRGNFIKHLYEKKLSLLAESKLTLLNYS